MRNFYKFRLHIAILSILLSTIACKVKKDINTDYSYKNNMLQLDLADKMKPQRIEASFPSLGLQYLCTIDKSKNIVVYTIDLDKTTLIDAIAFLNKEVGVEGASQTLGCSSNK